MSKSPASISRVDCGNGKKKVVIREREYDALSWQGLKTIVTVVLAVVALVGAVLFTYFTAEAAQNGRISTQAQEIATQKQRLDDNDKELTKTFEQFNETLKEQRKALDKTAEAVIRIDTRQETLIKRVEKIDEKLP